MWHKTSEIKIMHFLDLKLTIIDTGFFFFMDPKVPVRWSIILPLNI